MSRNLAQTYCYFCQGEVKLTDEKRVITKDDCGVYLDEYQGMIVADAECVDCEAKYLAWVDESKRLRYRHEFDPSRLFIDLSFRSTFNDEPGPADMPKWVIRETTRRERTRPFVYGVDAFLEIRREEVITLSDDNRPRRRTMSNTHPVTLALEAAQGCQHNGGNPYRVCTDCVAAAIAQEREACAKVADDIIAEPVRRDGKPAKALRIRDAIRARSNRTTS